MSERAQTKAWLQIHFCVFLWGFTAILGKLITLAALPLVWWRMLMLSALLALVPRVRRGVVALPARQRWIYAGIGVVLSLHWITFYGAIKLANASVAATCIALGAVFLAFIEPWVAKRRFDVREVIIGIAVIPGVAMVVGGTPSGMRLGIATGVLSAALVALFNALNKRYIHHSDVLSITFLEMAAGACFLTLLAPLTPVFVAPSAHDLGLLIVLVLACTLLPFALSLAALRHLSAFAAALAVNIEPIYAILLAIPLFGEQRELTLQFYVGVAIILGVVFAHPLLVSAMPSAGAAPATSIGAGVSTTRRSRRRS